MRRRGFADLILLAALILLPGSEGSMWSKPAVHEHREHVREHHVPQIIHQSWKDKNVPKGFKPWQDSWKKNHPSWEYRWALFVSTTAPFISHVVLTPACVSQCTSPARCADPISPSECHCTHQVPDRVLICRLWTDEDNRKLVLDHYPWFLDTYDALPKPIMKADSVRYLYMHHLGGAARSTTVPYSPIDHTSFASAHRLPMLYCIEYT
jgi:hypothetical protein